MACPHPELHKRCWPKNRDKTRYIIWCRMCGKELPWKGAWHHKVEALAFKLEEPGKTRKQRGNQGELFYGVKDE